MLAPFIQKNTNAHFETLQLTHHGIQDISLCEAQLSQYRCQILSFCLSMAPLQDLLCLACLSPRKVPLGHQSLKQHYVKDSLSDKVGSFDAICHDAASELFSFISVCWLH